MRDPPRPAADSSRLFAAGAGFRPARGSKRPVRGKHGPEKTGFSLLERNEEAQRWRLALVDEATAQVEPGPPTVETSPPIGRTAVVHIPVWFWTTDPWQPVSASATASIPLVSVTVTVTATPRQLTFAPGLGAHRELG